MKKRGTFTVSNTLKTPSKKRGTGETEQEPFVQGYPCTSMEEFIAGTGNRINQLMIKQFPELKELF
jgi:hypothetical protein